MSIFTENIKNTRFFLTILAVAIVFLVLLMDAYLIISQITINEVAFALFNTIGGILASNTVTAYNSYFKDRAAYDQIAAQSAGLVTGSIIKAEAP